VHAFRCYDNIARTRNVSECLYSLYASFNRLSTTFVHVTFRYFNRCTSDNTEVVIFIVIFMVVHVHRETRCSSGLVCRKDPDYTPVISMCKVTSVHTGCRNATRRTTFSVNTQRDRLRPNSISLSWSQTGPKLVADLQRAGTWPIV